MLSWVTAQDQSCVQCCDYQPTNTPGVFSILRGEKGKIVILWNYWVYIEKNDYNIMVSVMMSYI